MAQYTNDKTLTANTWTLLGTGPLLIENMGSERVAIAASDTTPTDTKGHTLPKVGMGTLYISVAKPVYAKCVSSATKTPLLVVTTPA